MSLPTGVPDLNKPDFSSGGAGQITFPIFTTMMLERYYAISHVVDITNTDYNGTGILNHGDKIVVHRDPQVTIQPYVRNQRIVPTNPDIEPDEMYIDHGLVYAISMEYVTKRQIDLPYVDRCLSSVPKLMNITISLDVVNYMSTQMDSQNQGAAAGLDSTYDLGTVGAPVIWNSSTCLRLITIMNAVLAEQNIPEGDRFVLLPSWAVLEIQNSGMNSFIFTGDQSNATLRKGSIGKIAGMTIYTSAHLPKSGGTVAVIFGTSSATSFVTQYTLNDKVMDPYTLSDIHRGLQVYGRKAFQPVGIGTMYIKAS